MPELPEMENYRRFLEQKLKGQIISSVEINREKSINVPVDQIMKNVVKHEITSIERRAKHLLFHLDHGMVLLLHLMLGGWMFFGTNAEKPDRTIQVKLSFGANHLFFIGLRLGYLHLLTKDEVANELNDLGPEPLDVSFTLPAFMNLVEGRRGRLKTKLVDQQFISGIGNCYSDEICYHAQLLPTRNLNELEQGETQQLYHSIRHVLKQATHEGGYMENPLYKGDTLTGSVVTKVYDREGERCSRCGSTIIKEMISSRKTFYCKGCQK
ncbi:Fpg/Nei family DNA glycosylase [Bacillus carboniphilus]|uniref:Formamidopyrimidine-DNA glycosylase n=1 Tax=Bacillus carboniphilus TaxID=86663 RepID=A0ABP3G034_9BACI